MTRWAWALAGVAAGSLALLILVGALLTAPQIATPLARRVLGGPDRVTLARAQLTYTPWPTARLRTLEIEGRGHAEAVDARINPLGVLPGVALIPRLSVTDGALLLELGRPRSADRPRVLREVAAADLTRVRLDIQRPERDPQVFEIVSAEGDLGSGAFVLEGEGGGASVRLTGEAAGLSLAGFRGRIRAKGQNFAELAALLGFAAPDTPPYALTGELARSGETWVFAPFDGEVGDSDLAGALSVDFAPERPFVEARLSSASLDFDDLGVIVGAPSDVEEGEPNARQQQIAAQYRRDERAVPDAELDISRVRAVDAHVVFEADAVRAGPAPLEALSAEIVLDDSLMRFDRLVFTAPQGRLETRGAIDARDPEDVTGTFDGRLEGFDLAQLGGGRILRGTLTAEFDVAYRGRRTREAFATLTGEAVMWSSDAEIRALAEEAAGLDLGETLGLLLTESEEEPGFRPARCLVARVRFEDGAARVDPAVLDTADSVTRVQGAVDLETERIALEVVADAKDVSWGALLGGAALGGTLRDPDPSAALGGAALQAGAAAVLGGLTAGLAALPFIEPGLGEDAPCAQLLVAAAEYEPEAEPPEPGAEEG
jgi:hypothetical protein